MTQVRAPLSVRIHDTHYGIWQDDPRDTSFRSEVFGPLIRQMRDRGWIIHADPSTKRNFPTLSPNQRLASKGTLRAEIDISGRTIKVEFWAVTWPICNRNGRRYDFDKLQRMEYLDRLRVQLEMSRFTAWLETIAPVSVSTSETENMTAIERIERQYAESWHSDKSLGRPVCSCAGNAKSKDGGTIEHGATVWFVERDGRYRRGIAYYNINNMWWVVCGKHCLRNIACFELCCHEPANLRVKQNARKRREKLEGELAKAIRAMDFQRAAVLKQLLFGDEPVYQIWARDKNAYYGPNYCGYTSDAITAGKYTRSEAEAEVKRVPHELEAIGPDGERIRHEVAA